MEITQLNSKNLDSFYKCFEVVMREGYSSFPLDLQDHFLHNIYTKSFYTQKVNTATSAILVVEDEGEVVGFLHANEIYGGVSFIVWLGVLPEYRRMGVATKMLNLHTQLIKAQKAHLIELNTYPKAMALYIKNGFAKIGERVNGYFGQDSIILNKSLNDVD